MFNATELLIDEFVQQLRSGYSRTYGNWHSEYAEIIAWAGGMAMENIANSDALYHNVEHSILVALVGQEIIRGRHLKEGGVKPEDWLHFIISVVCHDIGYVKGVCQGDGYGRYATGRGTFVELPAGASDASLTPYHVDRAKLFVRERFAGNSIINSDIICENIELTRFPVPKTEDHQDTTGFPGLLRSADLIGQLSDPRYLKKIGALFYEFEETGVNKLLGYENPADLRRNYPKFYWVNVYPYIKDAIAYLNLTQQGKEIVAHLYSNVFMMEHDQGDMVPALHRN